MGRPTFVRKGDKVEVVREVKKEMSLDDLHNKLNDLKHQKEQLQNKLEETEEEILAIREALADIYGSQSF